VVVILTNAIGYNYAALITITAVNNFVVLKESAFAIASHRCPSSLFKKKARANPSGVT
jgi:hypothetical protein